MKEIKKEELKKVQGGTPNLLDFVFDKTGRIILQLLIVPGDGPPQ